MNCREVPFESLAAVNRALDSGRIKKTKRARGWGASLCQVCGKFHIRRPGGKPELYLKTAGEEAGEQAYTGLVRRVRRQLRRRVC
jgi:hypothetical protein